MAITLKKIRADIDAANPVVVRIANGVETPLIGDAREAWLDETAEAAFRDEGGWANLRAERDALLSASDWTQVADSPVDTKAWAAYRKALRDLPSSVKHPSEVVWPTPPGVAE